MKTPALAFGAALLLFAANFSLLAQEKDATPSAPVSNLPEDPFKNLETVPEAKAYALEVDRTRGTISVDAKDGEYLEGSHFANWKWTMKAPRWGRYFVKLRYTSTMPKLGVQVKLGDEVVKSYAPRTGGHEDHKIYSLTMGYVYIPKAGEFPLNLLTGDKSKGPAFFVKGIDFVPAPESDEVAQGIDGSIELPAGAAATFSENMRFEPKTEKNCLGFWTNADDWAEWVFDVSDPGKFRINVVQGCGAGNGGSEVAVLVNDSTYKFEVEDTGGFQNWKTVSLGVVNLEHPGEHKVAIKPLTKSGKAVMDVQKVILTPVREG
ncbi:MAG: hypothetical protein KDN19_22005 [Verrucomicrobiae bacterium]|nr:hypothetical protein [Verrucomicrobiae bacterium]